jgi:hypothetical protein
MKTAAVLLALAMTAASATAGELKIVPPPKYDHPYAGNLAIWPVKTQQQVRDACPNAKFNLGHALACTWRFPGGETCRIVMVPDDQIKAAGLPVELVKRHEIAHCNGWPADHDGALPYVEWAEVPDKPATTKPAKQDP